MSKSKKLFWPFLSLFHTTRDIMMTWYWIRYIKINVSSFSSSFDWFFHIFFVSPFILFDMVLLIIYHIDLKIVSFCVCRFFDLSNTGCEKVIIRLSFSFSTSEGKSEECANTHKKRRSDVTVWRIELISREKSRFCKIFSTRR